METRQAKLDLHDETADDDYKDLQRMKRECDEWIEAAGLLVGEMLQVQGDSLKKLFNSTTTWQPTPEVIYPTVGYLHYHISLNFILVFVKFINHHGYHNK